MNDLSQNPLVTRQDMVRAALALLTPAAARLTPGKARMIAGYGSAHYSEDVAGMEGFSRALWALMPMLVGRCPEAEPLWALWREGIVHGTDPEHEEYWGDIGDSDQRMVEMAVLGAGLCFAPERFYFELSPRQRENLARWLGQINRYGMPPTNWRYFRILVNLGLRRVGLPADDKRLDEDLALTESHYEGDGWYFDEGEQRDYYTLWGFQYYNLLYAAAMREKDPERYALLVRRAQAIAPRFACWFDGEGRGLPYGRSLTYRFAQGSFYAAMAFAGVTAEGVGWGEMKGLLLRNLRAWLRLPVFDASGLLTVGYGYPNLCASEGYNAPGSPYWGLKAFLVLALPEEHPFWWAQEAPFPAPLTFLDPHPRMLLTRDEGNRQVVAYTAGNHNDWAMHADAKYEKFCYSTQFAFSVVKEAGTLQKGAYDSMLAVKRAGKDLWHARSGCDSFSLSPDRVRFTWRPMEGVTIDTVIAPLGMWHVRRHIVRCDCAVEAAEGAFAVCRDWAGKRPCDRVRTETAQGASFASAHGARGTSAIYALSGYERGEVVIPECNTNLMAPRTALPMLRAALAPGEHTLCCAVFTDAGDRLPDDIPKEVQSLAAAL